jgi:hypothetical protein
MATHRRAGPTARPDPPGEFVQHPVVASRSPTGSGSSSRAAGQEEEDNPDASTRARRLAATDDLEVSKASCRLVS